MNERKKYLVFTFHWNVWFLKTEGWLAIIREMAELFSTETSDVFVMQLYLKKNIEVNLYIQVFFLFFTLSLKNTLVYFFFIYLKNSCALYIYIFYIQNKDSLPPKTESNAKISCWFFLSNCFVWIGTKHFWKLKI